METWIVPITQNLIAALIVYIVGVIASKNKLSMAKVKGVANTATRMMWWMVWNVLRHIVIFAFLITVIRQIVSDPTPITKLDALAISFYTAVFWGYFTHVILMGNWDKPTLH